MLSLLVISLVLPSSHAAPRIVNGSEAGVNEFPEVVYLSVAGSSGEGSCTGTLIHPEWVLTAAHCYDRLSIADNPSGNTEVGFGPRTGSLDIVASDRVIIHEQYVALPDTETGRPPENGLGAWPTVPGYEIMTNDIALVHLREPVASTPMALNREPIDDSWIGREVTHVGFGITQFQGEGGGVKRHTENNVQSYTEAWAGDGANGSISFLDVGGTRSTCQGDSGGPGVYRTGDGYVQIGITSYGIECGSGIGSKMRVDLYIDWIEETAGIEVISEAVRPPTFECSHQLNPGSNTSIAIGTIPMELLCTVDSSDPQTIEQVIWYWGDGSEAETTTNLDSDHIYNETGVYNLRACISGDRAGAAYEDCIVKTNHVTACGVPAAEFAATPEKGQRITVNNTTSLRAHNCVSNTSWDVYAGNDVEGDPILSLNGWQPDFDLSDQEPGDYTIVLNVGGIGGTGAAAATVEIGRNTGCSTTGYAPTAAYLCLLPLLGLRRRD